MISRTKLDVDPTTIKALLDAAGIRDITNIAPLGAGEFNAVYEASSGGREYVLKIAPESKFAVMTYEQEMLKTEIFWYGLMREKTTIRVPAIYATDFDRKLVDADYFVMEKLSGTTFDKMDFLASEKEEAFREKARMAAELHRIHNDRFGYVQNGLHPNWYQAIRSMCLAIVEDAKRKHRMTRRGERLIAYIDKFRDILEKVPCSMVNFDIWDPNILCERKGEKIEYAWIDPERSFWGDRIADFVCLELFTPLKEKKESLKAYNEVAESPILATEEEVIRFAIMQGYLALIMEVEKYFRYSPIHFGWGRNVFVSGWLYKNAFAELRKQISKEKNR